MVGRCIELLNHERWIVVVCGSVTCLTVVIVIDNQGIVVQLSKIMYALATDNVLNQRQQCGWL